MPWLLYRMALLFRCIEPPPAPVEIVHKLTAVTGNSDLTPARTKSISKSLMLFLVHLKAVCLGIPPRFVKIGRIAIEESVCVIVKPYNIESRTILDLNPEKTLSNLGQCLYSTKPSRHHTGHSSPACVFTICPTAKGGRLRQASSGLARANVEAPGALKPGFSFCATCYGLVKFFTRKRCQRDRSRQFFLLVAEDLEEIHNVAIDIIIGFDRRGLPVDKHSRRARERLAILMRVRQTRKEPFKMAEFAAIPSKNEALSPLARKDRWQIDLTLL